MVLCQRLAETISKALATNLIGLAVGGTSVALAAIKLGASVSALGVSNSGSRNRVGVRETGAGSDRSSRRNGIEPSERPMSIRTGVDRGDVVRQQRVRQAAWRSALDAQAVLRKERADRERRLESLAGAMLTVGLPGSSWMSTTMTSQLLHRTSPGTTRSCTR